MKRHTTLHPLSHDHQNALARALRLRRAADLDAADRRAAVDAFLEFVDDRITPHFREEEALLERAVAATGLTTTATARERLLDEHAALTERFELLRTRRDTEGDLDRDLLRSVGQQLTDHIRFEERELFEQLQHELNDDQLRAVTDG